MVSPGFGGQELQFSGGIKCNLRLGVPLAVACDRDHRIQSRGIVRKNHEQGSGRLQFQRHNTRGSILSPHSGPLHHSVIGAPDFRLPACRAKPAFHEHGPRI